MKSNSVKEILLDTIHAHVKVQQLGSNVSECEHCACSGKVKETGNSGAES